MSVYHWIFLVGFVICFLSCMSLLLNVLKKTRMTYNSSPLGKPLHGVFYAMTGAMSPVKKETAYLHFPTYVAGILYHLGTFCSFFVVLIRFFNISLSFSVFIAIFLLLTSMSGLFLLGKRIVLRKMRSISNPDDYFSNILVTLFQILAAGTLIWYNLQSILLVYSALLMVYIPIGKLKHSVYFFTSRLHLGIFYGWRGVWPVKRKKV